MTVLRGKRPSCLSIGKSRQSGKGLNGNTFSGRNRFLYWGRTPSVVRLKISRTPILPVKGNGVETCWCYSVGSRSRSKQEQLWYNVGSKGRWVRTKEGKGVKGKGGFPQLEFSLKWLCKERTIIHRVKMKDPLGCRKWFVSGGCNWCYRGYIFYDHLFPLSFD